MKQASQPVYVFDVDGVLCDIGKPTNENVVSRIVELLEDGAYVAINTGRGQHTVHEMVTEPLERTANNRDLLKRLMIACEMGGVFYTFEADDRKVAYTHFRLEPEMIARARAVFAAGEYDTMMPYEKDSMATFIMRPDADRETYALQQSQLVEKLHAEFAHELVTIAVTIESIDAHAAHAGKQAGAEVIYDWLQQVSDIAHDEFICFGDNDNDYEMARWFADQGCAVEFVYTGTGLHVARLHEGVVVIDTAELYSQGTLEYLDAHLRP